MAPGTGAPQIFGIMCAVPEAPVTIFSKRVDLLYMCYYNDFGYRTNGLLSAHAYKADSKKTAA